MAVYAERFGAGLYNYTMKTRKESKIRELFGMFSLDYDKHMADTNHVSVQKSIIDRFLKDIKGKVLELATGTGVIARYIKDNTNCHVSAIDYCAEMIEEAKRKSEGIEYKLGNVHNLPYNTNEFDTVICSYGFYWFKDIEAVITEIKRVLKPTGRFILLEEELKEGYELKVSKYAQAYLKELTGLKNYVGVEYLKKTVESNGFNLLDEVRIEIDNVHDTIGLLFQQYENQNGK